MSEAFKRIEIACPKCGIEKSINVPLELFNGGSFGIIKIQVPLGGVCEKHNFLVLLNKKGTVLGYETFDMLVSKASEIGKEEGSTEESSLHKELEPSRSDLQNYIDKFGFNCIVGYLHSKLFDYPSYLICPEDLEIQLDKMESQFTALIPEEYRNSNNINIIKYDPDIYPLPGYFFDLIKKKYNYAFIINSDGHIINVPWQTNMEYEKVMLRNALTENNSQNQFKRLSEYINRFIEDVDRTLSFLNNIEKIKEKSLINSLNKTNLLSTINRPRLRLIREFISTQISVQIAAKIKI